MANFGKQKLKRLKKGLLVAASLSSKVQPLLSFIAQAKQHLNTKVAICFCHCSLEKRKNIGEKRTIKALHVNESRPWGLSLAADDVTAKPESLLLLYEFKNILVFSFKFMLDVFCVVKYCFGFAN